MAATAFNSAPTNASDATFTAWAKAISDALTAVGLLKTADTGQIDLTTTVTRASTNAYAGYEIRVFNDALQATAPVYIKIEYGTGGSTTYPGIRITVGTATDGAGALTGNTTTAYVFGAATADATSLASYISSDGSYLTMAMWPAASNAGMTVSFAISRILDDTGASTDQGINFIMTGTTTKQQFLPKTGIAFPEVPLACLMAPAPVVGDGVYGFNLGFFPIYPYLGYAGNPSLSALVYFTNVMTSEGVFVSVTLYGTAHTYVLLGATSSRAFSANSTAGTVSSVALRYE